MHPSSPLRPPSAWAQAALRRLLPAAWREELKIRRGLRRHRPHAWPLPERPVPGTPGYGVRVFGFHDTPLGLGRAAALTVDALRAAAIPAAAAAVKPTELGAPPPPGGRNADGPGAFPVNVVVANPPEIGLLVRFFGTEALRGRFNVGYWFWEQERLPRSWRAAAAYFAELWAPSRFVAGAMRGSGIRRPVRLAPLCVPPPGPDGAAFPEELGIGRDKALVLCMFDMDSTAARKNPAGAVEAVRRAAASRRDVRMVVKVRRPGGDPRAFADLRARLAGLDHVLLDGTLERRQILGLMRHAAAFVSLHRAEGFGLFLAEAMSTGCPVVATGYSGNMDFMDEDNSWPVRYRLAPNRAPGPHYRRGVPWAEPDVDDAADRLRWILDHPAEAARRAARGAETIARRFSPAAVGEVLRRALAGGAQAPE